MRPSPLPPFTTLLTVLTMSIQAYAQPAPAQPAPPREPTRILAIGTIPPQVDLAAVRALLPTEVRATVQLYLDGKIDQWFSLADRNGVLFLLNMTDLEQAAALLQRLPLGQAHLMHFDLMPLAPLGPLRELPGMTGDSR